jgi:outer membrane protein TolC
MKKWILVLLLPVQIAYAQETISLDSCLSWTRLNYPRLRMAELAIQMSSLRQTDLNTSYLPSLTATGQASWQSDVTRVEIQGAPFTVPSLSKDQYRASVDIRQTLWDGGVTDASRKLEEASLKAVLGELETELYKLNEQVSAVFFMTLILQKRSDVLKNQREVLDARLQALRSAIRNGIAPAADASLMEAEILQISLSLEELMSGKNKALKTLSLLTGKNITADNILTYSNIDSHPVTVVTRPEIRYFEMVNDKLELQKEVISRSRNPGIFGFGQAGYGKPGLNMLKNEFDPYLMVGAGVSWRITDWGKSVRARQMIDLQKENIETEKQAFLRSLDILREQQWEEILKLQRQQKTDQKLLELRQQVTRDAASRLENGTLMPADYIRELNQETIAEINLATRSLLLDEALFRYKIINGLETK